MNSECADAANIRCICMRCIGEKKCLPCRGIDRRVLMIIFWVGDVLPFFRPSVAIAIVLISFIFIRGVLILCEGIGIRGLCEGRVALASLKATLPPLLYFRALRVLSFFLQNFDNPN